jgi:thiol-disulfide isomerase/thioredoxin
MLLYNPGWALEWRNVVSSYVSGAVPVAVLAASLGLLFAGCSGPASTASQPAPPVSTDEPPERGGLESQPEDTQGATASKDPIPADELATSGPELAPAGAVSVRVVDEAEFARAIHQHQGKVVLVDVWATWCLNCLELFPHTVELSKDFADRGLVVVSLSMDEPESEASVLRSLRSNGATFENFISRYGGSDKSAEAFGFDDLILPKYRLYDRSGKLYKTIASPIEPDDVDRAVEELLGQG